MSYILKFFDLLKGDKQQAAVIWNNWRKVTHNRAAIGRESCKNSRVPAIIILKRGQIGAVC